MAIVREFEFKTGKGGKTVTIGQITDAHINTVNSYDMQNAEIADTFAHRKWGAGGTHIPKFCYALEYCKDFDRIILTGDILDYYSSASKNILAGAFERYKNVIACIGGHELTLEMETDNVNVRSLRDRYTLLEEFWCNDIHYYSEILEGKVTVILLDNNTELWMEQKEMFDEDQYRRLANDIESARNHGRIILMFMHEAIYSGKSETVTDLFDGKVSELRMVLPQEGTFSRKAYDLIVSSSDVIKGIFFGHEHSDFDIDIQAGFYKNGEYVNCNIPAHCLTSNALGNEEHIVKITVD